MSERLPKNACDTHLHVFGDAKRYPVGNPNALYLCSRIAVIAGRAADDFCAALEAFHKQLVRAWVIRQTLLGKHADLDVDGPGKICDQAGECRLQEFSVDLGRAALPERRFSVPIKGALEHRVLREDVPNLLKLRQQLSCSRRP